MVRTKKEFIRLINKMEEPVLYYGDIGPYPANISQSFLIKDNANKGKSFNLLGCKLLNGENLESYKKREKKLIMKYEKWLYDIFGNYGYVIRSNSLFQKGEDLDPQRINE